MVQSLEQYIAEATNAYKPAQNAIQTQLGALDSQYNTGEQKINRLYADQQSQLETQRNQAAEASSLAAAGSGGSFGGQGNIARRKYYDQTFVPAQARLQTNQSNDLDALRQNIENQRTSLNSQASQLESQANQMALQKYWADVEAEKQRQWEAEQAEKTRQAQIRAAQASNPWQYLSDGDGGGGGGGLKNWDFGNGYSVQQLSNGQARYLRNGIVISAAEFMAGANHDWNKWNDIWNNGVKTQGVGSDTVNLFKKMSGNPYLSSMITQDKSLSYLNNIKY